MIFFPLLFALVDPRSWLGNSRLVRVLPVGGAIGPLFPQCWAMESE